VRRSAVLVPGFSFFNSIDHIVIEKVRQWTDSSDRDAS
jgi:hypothetical protein